MASNWFHKNYFDNTLLMTAKGYPDYSSRDFLNQLMNRVGSIPCVFLGDTDPFGTDIYFQYLIANSLQANLNSNIWEYNPEQRKCL